jgi:Domain of unknown function (DUF4167)
MLNPMMKRTRTRLGVVRPKATTQRIGPSESSETTRNRSVSAQQSYERYVTMAREAKSMGDRIMSENYYQHAEHFLRLLKEAQPIITPLETTGLIPPSSHEGADSQEPGAIEEDATEYHTDQSEFDLEMELMGQHKI